MDMVERVAVEDLDWLAETFVANVRLVESACACTAQDYVEIDVEISRANDIIRRMKAMLINAALGEGE